MIVGTRAAVVAGDAMSGTWRSGVRTSFACGAQLDGGFVAIVVRLGLLLARGDRLEICHVRREQPSSYGKRHLELAV